jgi:hypothetical protein
MLADLFKAHKIDFIVSGKRTYHHYKTLRSTIAGSGLLQVKTIAKNITSNDVRAVLNHVYQHTKANLGKSDPFIYAYSLFIWR